MDKKDHDIFHESKEILPTDYADYGGTVERWKNPGLYYPDCSNGCKWARPLAGKLGRDWVICANPNSPRIGLLTFEHQAGFDCFEESDEEEDDLSD